MTAREQGEVGFPAASLLPSPHSTAFAPEKIGVLELLFCQFVAIDEPGIRTFATAIVPIPGVDTPFTTIVAPVGTVATPPVTFTAFPATPVNVCIGSNEL